MCGFAGAIMLDGGTVDAEVIERMSDVLRHRGPDDKGTFISGPVGFGFRRLSILDLSPSGHQPMTTHDGRYTIVYNGEIYNYVELRSELQKRGHSFRSSGDTEVLLYAYAEWGKDCLSKLNGMWAFLIYDAHRRIIFGSRDRFGVKPLYRYQTAEQVIFASEIKAILSSGHYAASTNWQTAATFFVEKCLDFTDDTFFTDIVKVPAGAAFELDLRGDYREWRYWSLSELPSMDSKAFEDPSMTFAELFEDAVRLRMRSDVAVGVSLSGGLDSTSIICSMARIKQSAPGVSSDPLFAFSYNAPEFDESTYIRDTLRQTQAQLVSLETDAPSLLGKLNEVLWYHDEPLHSMTALVGYELMRLARENGVKVVLSGQGADETIAGYPSYFRDYWQTLYSEMGFSATRSDIAAYSVVHGGHPERIMREVLIRYFKGKLRQWSAYRALANWHNRTERNSMSWFTPDFLSHFSAETQQSERSLDGALRFSIERKSLPLYLRIEDRNSMAHSVEMRLPFMDYRLISYLLQLPANWKMRGPWNKYVLREAMRQRIPESVRTRTDKMGFPVPSQKWLATGLRTSLLEFLDTQAMRERGIYNLPAIRRDIESAGQDGSGLAVRVFDLVQFEAWCQLTKAAAESVSVSASV